MFLLLLLLSLSSVSAYIDEATGSYYSVENRVAGTDQFSAYNRFYNQPYVANGFIGSRIPNLGFGFTYDQDENSTSALLDNGWPLFNKRYAGSFVAGFYDLQPNTTGTNFPELEALGYESVIAAIPDWTSLILQLNYTDSDGKPHTVTLDPQLTNITKSDNKTMTEVGKISEYYQELDFQKGLVTTGFLWEDFVFVEVTVFAHRAIDQLGVVHFDVSLDNSTAASNVFLNVTDVLTFESSQRTWLADHGTAEDGIFMSVHPANIPYKTATVFSTVFVDTADNDSELESNPVNTTDSVSLFSVISLDTTNQFNFTKIVGIASSDYYNDNRTSEELLPIVTEVVNEASLVGYEKLLESHEIVWETLWGDSRISIPSDDVLTFAAEASIYHLLANTRANSTGVTSALGVSGLSSDSYAGMVFWDADLWMLPALIPFAPDHAVSVSLFRTETHQMAVSNAEANGYDGAAYSWTSGRFGNQTSTGPAVNYEIHLNYDICLSIWKLFLAGAVSDEHLETYGYPIIRDAANFFASYVEYNETLGAYITHNITDPDEYANFKDNGAFTNAGVAQVMKFANIISSYLGANDTNDDWEDIQHNMYLPVSDHNVTLEYSGMNSSVEIKQADVVLITFPLDDNDHSLVDDFGYNKERAILDLNYYSEHQTSQGPAMTFPVFSAVAAKLNEVGCGSQTYLLKSIEPFLRFPFGQMSEQNNDDFYTNGGTHPAFPFLTGHGGVLQGFVYGLPGLSFGYRASHNYTKIDRVLHFDPVALPMFPGGITIEGFRYLNQTLNIVIDDEEATIAHVFGEDTIKVYLDSRNPEGGKTYKLSPGQNLTVPLFVPDDNFAGSVTECQADIYEITPGLDGDVIESLIDGDNSTTWQVDLKNETGLVLLDLGRETKISSGVIVWGNRLAKNVSLSAISEHEAFKYLTKDSVDSKALARAANETRVVESLDIKPSAEFTARSSEDVEVESSNFTTFDLKYTRFARYVVLEVDGVYDDSEGAEGAIIAELSLN